MYKSIKPTENLFGEPSWTPTQMATLVHIEMEKIITSVEFKGSFNEFLEYLRDDPRFYYDDAENLLDGYRVICKKVDAELPKYFMILPRTPYGVKPIPEYQAPASPTVLPCRGSLKAYEGGEESGRRSSATTPCSVAVSHLLRRPNDQRRPDSQA